MRKSGLFIKPFLMGLLFLSPLSSPADPWAPPQEENSSETSRISLPAKSGYEKISQFTWGIELGSSIDLSGYDTSTVDADLILGYRNNFIRTIGIGTGIHRAFGERDTFIPVYLVFNSSFRKRPAPCFFHLSAGYSFNTINNSKTFGDICASVGLGFNLKMGKRFMSHIIIGYAFRHIDPNHRQVIDCENINLAQLKFGLNF